MVWVKADVPTDVHRQLKIEAAKTGDKVDEVAARAIIEVHREDTDD